MGRRRTWLLLGLVAAVVTVAGSATGRTSGVPKQQPRLNVVLILADDERFDSNDRMRNVQRLIASRGVTFTNAFVTTSECCPSRASILCGQYAHTTGVVQNFGGSSYPRFSEKSNHTTWLHDSGYTTALIGKYLNDYTIYGRHKVPPGWSRWQAIDSVPEEAYYDYTLNEDGKLAHYGVNRADYSTDVLGRKARGFVATAREPFFLYFTPIAPHLPAIPAERDLSTPLVLPRTRPNFNERDLSDKPWHHIYRRVLAPAAVHYLDREIEGRQLRSLRELDRQVGALVDALKRRGALDHTVIIYMSDNGFLWGEHRLGGKIWPYEESIRVPLVIRAPWIRRPRQDSHFVLNIDLASTIAQLAGVRPRLPQDGRSLVPLLRREPVADWRSEFAVEYLGASQYLDGGPPPFHALRTERWLYVRYLNGWRELYDLRRDPYELRNLARDRATAALRGLLSRRLSAITSGA